MYYAQNELCPACDSEEWDAVTAERGRERDVPFNRCLCGHEWNPQDAEEAQHERNTNAYGEEPR